MDANVYLELKTFEETIRVSFFNEADTTATTVVMNGLVPLMLSHGYTLECILDAMRETVEVFNRG